MKIKFACGLLFILAIINSAYAQIVTNCTEESGAMMCKASESNVNLMDMKCKSQNGKTNCSGNYVDKTSSSLHLKCEPALSGVHCSGAASDGTTFKLACTNDGSDLKCDISDNKGESATMNCKIGSDGLPNCSAAGNDGSAYKISCNKNGNNKSCITEE